jgi:DNA-binding protein StpA
VIVNFLRKIQGETTMQIEFESLLNKRVLKAKCKFLSTEELIKLRDTLNEALGEREEEQAELERQKAEEEQKYIQAIDAVKSLGIDPMDLASHLTGQNIEPVKKLRQKMDPKYEYQDPDDSSIILYWSGKGPKPKKLIKRMEIDHRPDLEFYEIPAADSDEE